ncbi:MAG: GMC family oxidoreductase N-terminal domain-containing protein [Pseudomonadota bacterium]
MSAYDYVIVGGGSAGATLAARLSEDPQTTVCLIESGGDGTQLTVRVPTMVLGAVHGGRVTNLNWGFDTVPQPGLKGRTGYQPRGKGLGGSSAVNAMIYIRGNPRDYDEWGVPGWGWEDVRPHFLKSENNARGASDHHADTGPLHVRDLPTPYAINEDFIAACEAVQIPRNDDFNGASQTGAGHFQVTQFHDDRRGWRCSAAAAFLHPNLDRPNLHILTHAHAQRVTITEGRATGVRYKRKGREAEVTANREVILSAGAFQSPQLLMLSGIGPAAQLQRHGITVHADRPEVGQNLHDHPDFIIGYRVNRPDVLGVSLATARRALGQIGKYRRDGAGFWSSNIAESGAFFSLDSDPDWPDIQLHFGVGCVQDHGRKLVPGHAISLHTCILRPESRGSVGIRSANAADAPVIDPAFLTSDRDAALMLKGVKTARQIMASPPMAGSITKDLTTDGIHDDAALLDRIRSEVDSVYHPVGSCRMGTDAASVVDPELRVRGVTGLRVVDASIMPRIISGNTNAPTIMIAEKAADMIAAGE